MEGTENRIHRSELRGVHCIEVLMCQDSKKKDFIMTS